MRVETEEKYYCIAPEDLIKIAEHLKFKIVDIQEESDEYFTDINSEFIKNRTCLRIRKTVSEQIEITYKGKSDSLLGLFCKLENNITADSKFYESYVKLFSSLGYYSYVKVIKKRLTYELIEKNYKYSIMIDTLPEVGGFVEFEIISERSNSTKKQLKQELMMFVSKFNELKLKPATEPYRDIVAKHIKQKLFSNKKVLNLCVNLDGELLIYEKEFFKMYKDVISKKCGSNIKWGEYKKNPQIGKKIYALIEEYLDNLIFDSNELLVAIELLKKISYTKYFFTKANESFCELFFKKIGFETKNIFYLKSNDTLLNVLNKNNVLIKNCIFVNDADFRTNNSLLLILINEDK